MRVSAEGLDLSGFQRRAREGQPSTTHPTAGPVALAQGRHAEKVAEGIVEGHRRSRGVDEPRAHSTIAAVWWPWQGVPVLGMREHPASGAPAGH